MMVGDWKVADVARLTAEGWPADADPAKTVLLDKMPPAPPLPSSRQPAPRALFATPTPRSSSRSSSPSGAMLVLNDVWHPWWRATIDGNETEIFRANAIFRAVQVPSGKFTVRFTFEPLRGAWNELRARLPGS